MESHVTLAVALTKGTIYTVGFAPRAQQAQQAQAQAEECAQLSHA